MSAYSSKPSTLPLYFLVLHVCQDFRLCSLKWRLLDLQLFLPHWLGHPEMHFIVLPKHADVSGLVY